MGAKKWTAILAGVAAIIAAVAAVITSALGVEDQEHSNCSAQGEGNSVSCDEIKVERAGPSPSAKVVPGPLPQTWSLELRNWEANSSVELSLVDSNGDKQDLGEFGTREVAADGTADNSEGHYFWEHLEHEAKGVYIVKIEGRDTAGRPTTRKTTFTVPQ